jgi:hypothetical protein
MWVNGAALHFGATLGVGVVSESVLEPPLTDVTMLAREKAFRQ